MSAGDYGASSDKAMTRKAQLAARTHRQRRLRDAWFIRARIRHKSVNLVILSKDQRHSSTPWSNTRGRSNAHCRGGRRRGALACPSSAAAASAAFGLEPAASKPVHHASTSSRLRPSGMSLFGEHPWLLFFCFSRLRRERQRHPGVEARCPVLDRELRIGQPGRESRAAAPSRQPA